MDLPQTKRPSPLSPHFFYDYLKFLVPALVIAVLILVLDAYEYLDFLPFNPLYLLVLTLPFIGKAVKRELQRRHYEYIFKPERVIVRENVKMTGTIEQEDAPYQEITDISSESPPWEQVVDVGDLHIHLTGRDQPVDILGLRHPDRYENLMLGRESAEETVTDKESIEAELVDLERQYENGEIGRAEYERRYYYLQGKLDVLEAQE